MKKKYLLTAFLFGLTAASGSSIAVPANDLIENSAHVVLTPGATTVASGTTIDATFDNVGFCGTSNTTAGVWFDFSGTGGAVEINTIGSGYDTKLSVFTGVSTSLVCLTGNDDTYPGFQAAVFIDSSATEDYFLLVHGFGSATGAFNLNFIAEAVTDNVPLPATLALLGLGLGGIGYQRRKQVKAA
ncbi:MAG TPA: PEP-CTERM sorting domain-containing protein [Gammaproteobacteria bacterium]|nr:PEP-CTERM sorting domain-containing protein [Chromatiales bacterium]HPQ24777.1 PEP-CTERM sorting domain-containing protein [Gammaproteobacteria bacterium]